MELLVAGPFLEPDAVFFQCTNNAFGVSVASGVVVAGEDLLDAKEAAGLHVFFTGGLATVVADQLQNFFSILALAKLAIQGVVQGVEPIVGL